MITLYAMEKLRENFKTFLNRWTGREKSNTFVTFVVDMTSFGPLTTLSASDFSLNDGSSQINSQNDQFLTTWRKHGQNICNEQNVLNLLWARTKFPALNLWVSIIFPLHWPFELFVYKCQSTSATANLDNFLNTRVQIPKLKWSEKSMTTD